MVSSPLLRLMASVIGFACVLLSEKVAAQSSTGEHPESEIFHIYTPPSASDVSDTGADVAPEPLKKAMRYLESRGLGYRVFHLPWPGAMKRLNVRPRSLILPLDRTAEREELFYWIEPVSISEYYLYGVTGRHAPDTTIEDVIRSKALVSCGKRFAQCDLLTKAGIHQQNILLAEDSYIASRYRLMLNGHIDFTILDPVVYEALCKERGLDPTRLIKLQKIGDQAGYLAASINTPDEVLALLRKDPD